MISSLRYNFTTDLMRRFENNCAAVEQVGASLYYANSALCLLPRDKSKYLKSYTFKENLTYLTKSDEGFCVNFYDPEKAIILLETFSCFVKTAVKHPSFTRFLSIPSEKEYIFEEKILRKLSRCFYG